jgi:hypothetical protein
MWRANGYIERDRFTPGANSVFGQQTSLLPRLILSSSPPLWQPTPRPLEISLLQVWTHHRVALHWMQCEVPWNAVFPHLVSPATKCLGGEGLSENSVVLNVKALEKMTCPRARCLHCSARHPTGVHSPLGGNRAFRGAAPDFSRPLIGRCPGHPTANQAGGRWHH